MKLRSQPYNFFLLAAAIALIVSIFYGDESLDFHLHDTYYVIALNLWRYTGICLIGGWCIYKLAKPFLFSNKLSIAHISLTLTSLFAFVLFSWWANEFYHPMPRRYIDYSNFDRFPLFSHTDYFTGILIIIFILAQLLFLVNITIGLLKLARKQ